MATLTPEEHAYLLVVAAMRTPFDHARKREPGWEWSVNFIGNAFGPVVWQTREQAEWHIKELWRLDKVNVENSFYSIDGPNEEGNEFAKRYIFSFGMEMNAYINIEAETEQDARDQLNTMFGISEVQAYSTIDDSLVEYRVCVGDTEPTLYGKSEVRL